VREDLPTGTVTFLFTDIERSTELARHLGADFGRIRAEHHRIMREAIAAHAGQEIDTAGDGFFVVFERAGDAVAAAVEAQHGFHALGPVDVEFRVRMGIHSAEPYIHERSYVGVGVHRAARICAAGHGGQIVLSNATAGIVEDLELVGLDLLDLGEFRLKDIERPQRLFQILIADLPAEFPDLRTADAVSLPTVATFLFADAVDWASSVLRELGDDGAAVAAERFQHLVVDTVRTEGGYEREVWADKVFAVFGQPIAALRAAVSARRRLREEPWFPGERPPEIRIGIHTARLGASRMGHVGSAYSRTAELCMSAEPGQILVSQSTEGLLEGEVLDLTLRDLGERELRDWERRVRVFDLDE